MLLDAGYRVFAIEPNEAMRAPAEKALGQRQGFVSVDARAEATGLAPRSVDAVIAAQAFHWFDPPRARAEFERILRPGGPILLVWNERRATQADDGFLRTSSPLFDRCGGMIRTTIAR
jgi:SAM-dependent methyltransferase